MKNKLTNLWVECVSRSHSIDALSGIKTVRSTGESADDKYAKLAESKNNFIFLDLEMTHGFYDPLSASSRILEVSMKR